MIWKVRQKSTGLFWNGNRWAALEGGFLEQRAENLDEERELVEMATSGSEVQSGFLFGRMCAVLDKCYQAGEINAQQRRYVTDRMIAEYSDIQRKQANPTPPKQVTHGNVATTAKAINYTGYNAVATKAYYVGPVLPATPPPPDFTKDARFPKSLAHPNTGEPFVSGKIYQEIGNQKLRGADGSAMSFPVHGAGMTRGTFETRSGAAVEGYMDGGTWQWTDVSVPTKVPF